MNIVNWFEIPVTDLARAKKFYTTLFNVELMDMTMPGMEMAMFPWVQGAPNSAGCLLKAEGRTPSANATSVYLACNDVNEQLALAEANGGKIITPKYPLGNDWGFAAHIIDSEGNRIGFSSPK